MRPPGFEFTKGPRENPLKRAPLHGKRASCVIDSEDPPKRRARLFVSLTAQTPRSGFEQVAAEPARAGQRGDRYSFVSVKVYVPKLIFSQATRSVLIRSFASFFLRPPPKSEVFTNPSG
jgi:hypothetical protein